MRQSSKSKYIAAFVCLLTFILAGQGGVQGYIWCLGENGQSALEFVPGSSCGTGLQQPGGGGVENEVVDPGCYEKGHCGPCVDVPASCDAISRRQQDDPDHPDCISFSPLLHFVAIPAPGRNPAFSRFTQQPPPISQTLLAHRTVVLLN